MKLLHQTKTSWVGVPDNHSNGISGLQNLEQIEVHFSDFDDTHAYSPAKIVARRALGTNHLNPFFINWCLQVGMEKSFGNGDVDSKLWKKYVDLFLQTPAARREVKNYFTPTIVSHTLFPGVQQFAARLSHADSAYVTRNINEVADAYAQFLGFNSVYANSYDKAAVVQGYVRRNPCLNNFLIEGDSREDGEMIEALRQLNRNVVSIQVMSRPGEMDPRFTYATSRDRTSLLELMSQ